MKKWSEMSVEDKKQARLMFGLLAAVMFVAIIYLLVRA